MEYIIGIDIGTSGTKSVACTAEGNILASAYTSYPVISTGPGVHELSPDLLYRAVLRTVLETREKAGAAHRPLGLCFSSAMHSVAALDKNGKPLSNLITWADLRSKDYASAIGHTREGYRLYQRTGTPIHPMSPLCKIAWLRETHPLIFARTAKFIGIKEYIWFRLFGDFQVDYSIASGTGLFDIYLLKWNEEALHYAGIREEHLSQPVPPGHTAPLPKKIAVEMNLPEGIPCIIGASDGCLANLGTGAILPGDMAVTIGTSGAVRMITEEPVADPQARLFNYYLSGQLYVCGGAINNGMISAKWFAEEFMHGEEDGDLYDTIESIRSVEPGCGGLIFLPYLLGERAPVWDANARAVFFGVREIHGRNHFMRSVVEGVSFSLYQISRLLREKLGASRRILVSGGFVRSEAWLETLADIFGNNISVTADVDASSMGAAILGLVTTGRVESLEYAQKMPEVKRILEPNMDHHLLYRKNFEVYDVLYERLRDKFELISHQ